MTSEAQIAANHANSLRSTGPKSAAGKSRSSMNARKHGSAPSASSDSASSRSPSKSEGSSGARALSPLVISKSSCYIRTFP